MCVFFFHQKYYADCRDKKVALSDHSVQKNICLLWLINVAVAFTVTHLKGCSFDMYQFSSSEVDFLLASVIKRYKNPAAQSPTPLVFVSLSLFPSV